MRIAAGLLLFCILIGGPLSAGEDPPDYLPADGEFRAWKRSEVPTHFVGGGLYGHINGGAEIFHEYSFIDLWVARYSAGGGGEITLEAYRMKSPEEAYGIFSVKRSGQEKKSQIIEGLNWVTDSQINLVKGAYYINITAFDCPGETLEAFAALVAPKIEGEPFIPPPLSRFPQEGQAASSGRFIQGQLAATAESILFGRDFWGFKTGTLAYSVRYLPSQSKAILIQFKEPATAIEDRVKRLFMEYLEDVTIRDGIVSGKNAVGRIFLFKAGGREASLIQGEQDREFADFLLDALLHPGKTH